ncbi:sigma-54 dependent transcriptional regulator [Cupriavidus taiwanensis]|uniref:SIGMA-54 INTERACTING TRANSCRIPTIONal REGULATOR n=2 Tax=Cupriavidus taiwanensis TaxID=164546 RepID=B3R303_CUPTR|nr:sigma-54 dependent transcriptional regulator [Cupriavidus taiwanensis]CAQ68684.1 putative SIGMA-54 INTERACTING TRANSCRIPTIONal REGULATOR [Cupriavidus taiwanensis LMG 19424]SOY55820.1 putative SIGMA-54 INTERACTING TRANSCRIPTIONal REGULATOR [Cupriavidus taiwanensis]SOY86377.1 putative SIGMA-54 INTERACTING TRANSCRIPTIONal REGULATOR [Cupriavidus taiwanensis]SOZ01670.1 putative SIGMA-54 INTERACTING TRANSCRIPTIONal REGULATOR [Cupriavidus taiwanensis]SOZ04701.1 putative SIGMA-54 INTERACTING TRANSC
MSAYANRPLLYLSQHHDATLCRLFAQRGWKISFASNLQDLQAMPPTSQPLAALLDLQGGFGDAELETFEPWLAQRHIGWIGIVAGQHALSETARRLLGLYFVDYHTAPLEQPRLAEALGHALGMARLRPGAQHETVRTARPDGMIGSCPAMQSLFRGIEKVSRWDTPVLISGESGTGKELAAQAIHRASARASRPFIAVNCAAIPPTLLMSELFGYERGAFTGATKRKPGRIEMAQGGTLFLDEIGDMPIESQTSLLRFLETGRIERLGGTESVEVDVRIISATHVDLEAAIAAERFRGDLYHRLCVLRVRQPPLRERGSDILLIAEHVLDTVRKQSPARIRGFSPMALRAIQLHTWPGNVRELINRIRHAAAMCEDGVIQPDDLELAAPAEDRPLTLAAIREAAEQNAIVEALQRHHERLIDVAAELGISRVTLFRLMRDYKLQVKKGDLGLICVQG